MSAVVPGTWWRCCQVVQSSNKKEEERKADVQLRGWEHLAVPCIPGALHVPGGPRAGAGWSAGVHSTFLALGQAGGCWGDGVGLPTSWGFPARRPGKGGLVWLETGSSNYRGLDCHCNYR